VNRLIIAGIGVLAVALLATGCGGGGGDEATAQVSKAQFFKQARAICARTEKRFQAEEASESLATIYRHDALHLKREAEELESISGSEQVEEEIKPFIGKVFVASRVITQIGPRALTDPRVQAYKKEAYKLHFEGC